VNVTVLPPDEVVPDVVPVLVPVVDVVPDFRVMAEPVLSPFTSDSAFAVEPANDEYWVTSFCWGTLTAVVDTDVVPPVGLVPEVVVPVPVVEVVCAAAGPANASMQATASSEPVFFSTVMETPFSWTRARMPAARSRERSLGAMPSAYP
jgi:hypothetical protein